MRHLRLAFWFPVVLLVTAFQTVPAELCQQVIQTAMAATHSVCDGLGRNEACYGNHLLEASPQPGLPHFRFAEVGDVIDITGLESLRLSAMDRDAGLWGIALMRMQANIPNRLESRNVTMVLFGDVEVRNNVRNPHYTAVRTRADSNINVRRYPDPQAYVMTTLQPHELAIADGRSEDANWLHVRIPETSETGWVSAGTVQVLGDGSRLRVVDALTADFGPMQAFYLNTAENDTGCQEAPENGVLIQTPEGVATVDLWINEVKIRLGSTAYIQARPNEDMTITMIEGETEVEALGVDQVAVAGTQITVAMNSSLQPSAPPSLPYAYSAQDVQNIPLDALERQIEIAPPLDTTNLDVLVDANLADSETQLVAPTSLPPSSTPTETATSTATFLPTVPPTETATSVPTMLPTDTESPTTTPTVSETPQSSPTPTPEETLIGSTFGNPTTDPGAGSHPPLGTTPTASPTGSVQGTVTPSA